MGAAGGVCHRGGRPVAVEGREDWRAVCLGAGIVGVDRAGVMRDGNLQECKCRKGLQADSVLQLLGLRTAWVSAGDGGGECAECRFIPSRWCPVGLQRMENDMEASVTDGLWPVGGDRTPATGISERLL